MLGLPVKFVTEMIETESFSRPFHKIFQLEVEQRVSCRQLLITMVALIVTLQCLLLSRKRSCFQRGKK